MFFQYETDVPFLRPSKSTGGTFPMNLLNAAMNSCLGFVKLLPILVILPLGFFTLSTHAQRKPFENQGKRKVIIDQDCAGPGGTDMQAVLPLINSAETDVLRITRLTRDAWRGEEIQHTLPLLEIIC